VRLCTVISEAREQEARDQLANAAFIGWQLGQSLGALQLQAIGAMTGAKVDIDAFQRNYPSYQKYLEQLGIIKK
jgi:hypothetical protein